MESRDPISKRYVYEPGLEDGATGDYIAELERLGYRKGDDVTIPNPEAKQPEIIMEPKSQELKEEVAAPPGWLILHDAASINCSRLMIREQDIMRVSEDLGEDGQTYIMVRFAGEASDWDWYKVKESFDEIIQKIKEASYSYGWKV